MEVDLGQTLGIIVAVVALFGGYITRDRYVIKQIADAENRMHKRVSAMKDTYVHKADMATTMSRLHDDVKQLREDIKDDRTETNRRLDTIIATITNTYAQAAMKVKG